MPSNWFGGIRNCISGCDYLCNKAAKQWGRLRKPASPRHDLCFEFDSQLSVCGWGKDNLVASGRVVGGP
jgi:hypothetical protein